MPAIALILAAIVPTNGTPTATAFPMPVAIGTAALTTDADPNATLEQRSAAFVDRRLETAELPIATLRYLDYPGRAAEKIFTPNPAFWAKDIDFSCVSPWNSGGGALRAGTAISKRHIILANHFALGNGTRLYFVGQDGGVCVCTLTATMRVGKTDILVGLLDAELTPNIHPAKVLPENYAAFLKDGTRWPIVTFNQRKQALVTDLVCKRVPNSDRVMLSNRMSDKFVRRQFHEKIIVGDSGNPAFVIIDGQPVLLYCLHSGGVGLGPMVHDYRAAIQKAMDELIPGYWLEPFNPPAIAKKQ